MGNMQCEQVLAGKSLGSETGRSQALADPVFAYLRHQSTTLPGFPLLWPSKT